MEILNSRNEGLKSVERHLEHFLPGPTVEIGCHVEHAIHSRDARGVPEARA
jgi:hypothetical protein